MQYTELNPAEIILPSQVRKLKIVAAEKRARKEPNENELFVMITAQYSGNKPQRLTNGQEIEIDGLELSFPVMLNNDAINYNTGLNRILKANKLPELASIDGAAFDEKNLIGLGFKADTSTEFSEARNEMGEPKVDPDTGKPYSTTRQTLTKKGLGILTA